MEENVPVEVLCRFNGSWSRGFEIVESTAAGYRLRRLSDQSLLPGEFGSEQLREVERS